MRFRLLLLPVVGALVLSCSDGRLFTEPIEESPLAPPAAALFNTSTTALPDLSPWRSPAGLNQGTEPDIILSGPTHDGVPVEVTVTVFNRGDGAVDTALDPLQVILEGNNAFITTDAPGNAKTVDDGTVLGAGESLDFTFVWTPNLANNTTSIVAFVNPSNLIAESNTANNTTILSVNVTEALPDLSPWRSPAGVNQGTEPDIILSGPTHDGVPVEVTVTVFNRGDGAVDTALDPLQVRLSGDFSFLTIDENIKTIDDGTIIGPSESLDVTFLWTPKIGDNNTQIIATVDPFNVVSESNEINNVTTLSVNVTLAPALPGLTCGPFERPLIMDDPATAEVEMLALTRRDNRTVPVKVSLFDAAGAQVTDQTIPARADGERRGPEISVSFTAGSSGTAGTVDSELLSPGSSDKGTALRYNDQTGNWEFNLATRDMRDPGVYTIILSSGDEDTYQLAQPACSIPFLRQ